MTQITLPLESTSVIKNLRNYLAGQAVGISTDEALLEEVLKVFFCVRLNPENYSKELDQLEIAKVVRNDFSKIKKTNPDLYDNNDEILLDPNSIYFTVDSLKALDESNRVKKVDIVSSLYQAFIGGRVRGQEGQFFTPPVAIEYLVNAVDPKVDWKIIDTACGACSFLSAAYLHLVQNHKEDEIRKFVKNNLYGIEKDRELSRLAKIHLTLLTGEMPNIINNDSLLVDNAGKSAHVGDGEFDLVITNPPFGAKIKAADEKTAKHYSLGHKWEEKENEYVQSNKLMKNAAPQVLFTERNIKALKPGGILATVVPESLLSNKNYRSATQYLKNSCEIISVVGMPESLFKTSGKGGTHTKTCLLLAKKKNGETKDSQPRKIFMAEAKWCGHDSRGNTVPKNDLPEILDKYKLFNKAKGFTPSPFGYLLNQDMIENGIYAPRYYDIEFSNWKTEVSKKNKLHTIESLVEEGVLSIKTGDEVGKLAYGTGEIPYIRTSDISNWETKIDNKHNVSEEVYDKFAEKQDVQKGDILMVKDGTYLIGTIGMVTAADKKIVYQSHLYKIRVNKNKKGITPYNFFGLLSSNFVQRQIKSKQLTQDIIDSLGRRIYELEIPIPKKSDRLKELDVKFKKVFELKEKARKETMSATESINSLF